MIVKLYLTITEDRNYRSSAAFFFATYTKGSQTKAGWHCAAKDRLAVSVVGWRLRKEEVG